VSTEKRNENFMLKQSRYSKGKKNVKLQKRAVRVKIPTTLTIRKMMTDFSRNRTESQITAKRNIRQSQRVIQKRMLRSRQLRLHFSAVLTK
jgi:hypothetical protein